MKTRRDFLKLSGLLSGALFLPPLNLTALASSSGSFPRRNLFFDPAKLPEIREKLKLPLFQSFWEEFLKADLKDDEEFLRKDIQLNNQIHHLLRADKILMRESFVFAMTENKRRGNLARLALQKILQFKKWDYFIDGGKYIIGLQRAPLTVKATVLAYSYLDTFLSAEERREIMQQLPVKGCEPCYRSLYGMLHPKSVLGWGFDPESSYHEVRDMSHWPYILRHTNLRAVPLSALGLGALFLGKLSPRTPEWLKVVQESYDDFSPTYQPDGSYPEGTSYCRYASQELILFLNALQRTRGDDWYKAVNWPGVMDFFLMTTMPSSTHPVEAHVNFGDGGGGFSSEIGFWVANRYGNARAQWAAENKSQYHTPFSVLWYNPKMPAIPPKGKWFFRTFDTGWVIATTGFDPKDFLLALRSGPPANHEHADRNSLIVKCCNENLFVDNWHPPYNHLDPGWPLRTSPAHNTVLINGKGHQYHKGLEGTNASKAHAKVVNRQVSDWHAAVTSDATQAYQLVTPDVAAVFRSFFVIPELRFFLVVDRLRMKTEPARFQARWFIENEDNKGKISFQKERFVFNRPEAKLVGLTAASGGAQLAVGTFPVPKKYGVFPYLELTAGQKGKDVTLLTACVAQRADAPQTPLLLTRADRRWSVSAQISGQPITVSFSTDPLIPDFVIRRG